MKKISELIKMLKYIYSAFVIIYSTFYTIITLYLRIIANYGNRDVEINTVTASDILKVISENTMNILIMSIMISLVIGIVIYLLKDKTENYLKKISLLFLGVLFISGFAQNVVFDNVISVDGFSICDYWEFPVNFIIPIVIIYATVLVLKYKNQKNISNSLNKYLKDK